MAKLRVLSGREVCQILSQHGFAEVRRRGSHIVMQRRTATGTVTVPVPDHHEIRLGTLQSIIRQSGIARSEFESQV
ncbi:MAG: type II toxin-antitoxin system HicA family toxin [Nitrospirae bacterium]|nr:type II toxin-antitoxin system HicA family toxin [Nitrospirota bacterium]